MIDGARKTLVSRKWGGCRIGRNRAVPNEWSGESGRGS